MEEQGLVKAPRLVKELGLVGVLGLIRNLRLVRVPGLYKELSLVKELGILMAPGPVEVWPLASRRMSTRERLPERQDWEVGERNLVMKCPLEVKVLCSDRHKSLKMCRSERKASLDRQEKPVCL